MNIRGYHAHTHKHTHDNIHAVVILFYQHVGKPNNSDSHDHDQLDKCDHNTHNNNHNHGNSKTKPYSCTDIATTNHPPQGNNKQYIYTELQTH